MRPRLAWSLSLVLGTLTHGLAAQSSGTDLLSAGVHAYQRLDLGPAVGFLEQAVAESGGAALSPIERVSALSYLAAANLAGGRRTRAALAFRELVEFDARARPDSLVFPPVVMALYDEVRRTTPAVAVDASGGEIRGPDGSALAVRVFVTVAQRVEVTVRRENGTVFASLYSGHIVDSADLAWNGRGKEGQLPDSGRMWLRVVGHAPTDQAVTQVIEAPLDVSIEPPDTTAWPVFPAESLLPERSAGRADLRPVLAGGLLSGAVVGLPGLIAAGVDATPARFAVAVCLGVAGVGGALWRRVTHTYPANIRANAARREAWTQAVAATRAQNARLLGDATTIIIHSGSPARHDGP